MNKRSSSIASRALMAGIFVLFAAATVPTTGRAWSLETLPGGIVSQQLNSSSFSSGQDEIAYSDALSRDNFAVNAASTSINVRVSSGNDDAEQRTSDGFMYFNSTDLELTNDPGVAKTTQAIGMRFKGVAVPKGASITAAYLTLQVKETSSEATSLIFQGEAADNAAAFASGAWNITNRAKTGASVAWNNIAAWNTAGANYNTPEMKSIIQEIVNRSGWASGNSMVILVTGSGRRVAKAYDGYSTAAPLLHIDYTAAPAPGPTATAAPNPTATPGSSTPLPVGVGGSWRMVFQDEFNGSALDKGKWHTCFWWQNTTCTIESNKELELYNAGDVYLQNGTLVLRAQKRDMTAWNGSTYNYTSGLVMTGGSSNGIKPGFTFKYGYVEARVKVPKGKGLWPALWMLPASYTTRPEIDIMEIIGDKITDYNMNYHYNGGDVGKVWTGPDFSAGYHVMGIDWQPGAMVWYVDGVERWRVTSNVSNVDEYVLLNLAVGGNWPGSPDSNTVFPAYMNVDYVRIWQH